ncbi:MAG TPA: flavodoxin family protein [Methanospirillum sp.]|uniref:flavodoxin family protein n=1 Tax=Methanospirillum sp. TaxID=45200 RepID=UPI002D169892|nr:flavodoxin family protein [Methanospirillum sp.]HWQ64099.1 flavodoxin family protein [Methanospirillum sp.]
MGISVLAISGSPRRHGNSEQLMDWVLSSMVNQPDVSVQKITLVDVDIRPCRGCNACEKLNRCVIRDGMDQLHDQIIQADCIIVSSPIYCMSVCSQVKALIDRAQVFRSRKYVLKLPVVPPERKGKRLGLFISSAGQDWSYVFDAAIPVMKCFFHVIEVRDRDIEYLMINHVDEKGAVLNHSTAQRDAMKKGSEIISILRERLSA